MQRNQKILTSILCSFFIIGTSSLAFCVLTEFKINKKTTKITEEYLNINISGNSRVEVVEFKNKKEPVYLAYHLFGGGLSKEEACENAKSRVMGQGCTNVGGRVVITSDCTCNTIRPGGPWQCSVEYYCEDATR